MPRLLVGIQPDGSTVVTTNQRVMPAGRVIPLRGARPKDLAVAPNGETVAITTTGNLQVLDARGRLTDAGRVAAGPMGVQWNSTGTSVFVSEQKSAISETLTRDGGPPGGSNIRVTDAPRPAGTPDDCQPTGLALSSDGKRLFAALGTRNCVAVIDLTQRAMVATVPVGVCPYGLAITPNGKQLVVANRGGSRISPSGSYALSAGTPTHVDHETDAADRGSVTIIDTATLETREVRVGRQPHGIAITSDSHTAYVSNSDEDTISIIDLAKAREADRFSLALAPDTGFGRMPTGMAIGPLGKWLYVALGGLNAVAKIRMAPKPYIEGYIPTGWYPIDVACTKSQLVILNAKGQGSRDRRGGGSFGVHDSVGTIQIVPYTSLSDMPGMSARVALLGRWGREMPARRAAVARPVPERVGEPSVFKHVIYVIKENHTYDVTLGDMREGNGRPDLCLFGEDVTPNMHALARQFVLLDNTYTSGTNSADGHQWTSSAICNAYMEQNYSSYARSYPYDGGDPLAYSPAGFLWNAVARQGMRVRVYGEFVNRPKIIDTRTGGGGSGDRGADRGTTAPTRKTAPTWSEVWQDYKRQGGRFIIKAETDNASLRKYLHPNAIGFPMVVPDQYRADLFISELRQWEESGGMPSLSMILLPNDHTAGTQKGMPTPRALVADNDLAFGRIVEAVSHSKFWRDTLIVCIEDDSQLGLDHVDGHRTLAFCVSPYTKRGAVVSRLYNHTTIIRTIELVLGVPAMNRFDRSANTLRACFNLEPDFRPYVAIPNRVRLDEMNPNIASSSPTQRRLAALSARQDWSQLDRADPNVVARSAWESVRPGVPFPAGYFDPPDEDD